jgi:hypothetical protein
VADVLAQRALLQRGEEILEPLLKRLRDFVHAPEQRVRVAIPRLRVFVSFAPAVAPFVSHVRRIRRVTAAAALVPSSD